MPVKINIGDHRVYTHTVTKADFAVFPTQEVHQVYATFALGRDAEWCCRLFVLDMKQDEEEGIGTALTIQHLAPAFEHETVTFTAWLTALNANKVSCNWEAYVNHKLIAKGTTTQKILPKNRLSQILKQSKHG